MDLDSIHPVDNMSDLTMQTLIERIEQSRTQEQFIYREVELDELWRLVDLAVRSADSGGNRSEEELRRLRDVIHRAHDYVGADGDRERAAAALRQALT